MFRRATDSAAAVAPAGLKANGPLLALCCLGTVLFLIAATIILALIPIYTATKDVTLGGNTQTYYFTLSPSEKLGDDGVFNDADKLRISQAISQYLGFTPDTFTFDGNVVVATTTSGKRRRRGLGLARSPRQVSPGQHGYGKGRLARKGCKNKCSLQQITFTITVTLDYCNGKTITFTVYIYLTAYDTPATQASSTTTSTTRTSTGVMGG